MNKGEIIIYKNDTGLPAIEVALQGETLWLTQRQIADVFGVNMPAINKHINNILRDEELSMSTVSNLEIVQQEGRRSVKRTTDIYNLDMVYQSVTDLIR